MAYPAWLAGQRITAARLRAMVDEPVVKAASTPRASTVTCTPDPELQGMALDAGTWRVRAVLFTFLTTAATTVNFRVKWTFTGAASGNRRCLGIAAGSTSTTSSSMRSIGSALGTEQIYGCTDTFYHPVEETALVIVTAAGNLSIDWAQGTSSANAMNLGTNSFVEYRRVA